MLAKNDIFEAVQTLNYCIDMASDTKCDLLAEIVEYLSCDELNTMLDDICNTWFNCSLYEIDSVMNAIDEAEEMRYIIE